MTRFVEGFGQEKERFAMGSKVGWRVWLVSRRLHSSQEPSMGFPVHRHVLAHHSLGKRLLHLGKLLDQLRCDRD